MSNPNVNCARLAAQQETVYGTAAANPYMTNAFSAPTGMVANSDIITFNEINGSAGIPYLGQVKAGYDGNGGIPMYLRPGGMNPLFMKMLLGDVVSTALGGGAYSHVFSLADICGSMPSYTLYEDMITQKKRWLGCGMAALNVKQAVRAAGTFDWTAIAQKDEECVAPTFTESTARPLGPADLVVTFNGASFGVEDVGFGISNGLQFRNELNGTMFPAGFTSTDYAADGTFSREFTSVAVQRRFWGAVAATSPSETIMDNTLVFQWTSLQQIAVSGQYYTFKFDFKNVTLEKVQMQIPARGSRIIEPIAFRATQDAAGDFIEVTIINDEASIGV